jgi:serine/threonine protein kinase
MEGIKKIRAASIAHLDIKIDNVFVNIPPNDDSVVQLKIGDFGMA